VGEEFHICSHEPTPDFSVTEVYDAWYTDGSTTGSDSLYHIYLMEVLASLQKLKL